MQIQLSGKIYNLFGVADVPLIRSFAIIQFSSLTERSQVKGREKSNCCTIRNEENDLNNQISYYFIVVISD